MTDTPNAEEARFWSGTAGQSWIDLEDVQDRLLSELSDVTLSRAGLKPGDRAIDIGCGTGALTVAAAEAVGDKGRILATDIAPPFVARTAERASHLPQVATYLGDAQIAEWPEAGFDAAISRLGVMFFADPPKAFANIASALRPGGRMTFTAWAPAAVNPYWSDTARISVDRLGAPPKSKPNTPGPMGLSNRDWSLEQFRAAGLGDVACEEVDAFLPVDGPPEKAAALSMQIGPPARVIRLFEASDADRAAILDGLTRLMEAFRQGERVMIPARLLVYSATAG